jgi:hypothetical protein
MLWWCIKMQEDQKSRPGNVDFHRSRECTENVRFRDSSVACSWRPLEGVFPVPKAVAKSMSRYFLNVDGF